MEISSTSPGTVYASIRDDGDANALQTKVLALEEQVKKLGDLVASLQIEGKATSRLLRFGRSRCSTSLYFSDASLQIMAIDKEGDITMEFDVFRPESSWNGGSGVARQITNYKPMR